MVVRLLALSGVPGTDAADALGMAICHAHAGGAIAALGDIAPALAKKGLRVRGGRLVG
jgi:crossover junction endodeoxyribonuclease RuvC